MGYNLEAAPNTFLSQVISNKTQQVFWGQKSRV